MNKGCALKKTRHAFVFTLDAFIASALTMALVAILLFMTSISPSYYEGYKQAGDVARDALTVLNELKIELFKDSKNFTTAALLYSRIVNDTDPYSAVGRDIQSSVLEQIAVEWNALDAATDPQEISGTPCDLSREFLEVLIAPQYGFNLSIFNSSGGNWVTVYSSNCDCNGNCGGPGAARRVAYTRALMADFRIVSGIALYGNYTSSMFKYYTCHGDRVPCEPVSGPIDFETLMKPTALRLAVWT